jgi:Fe(3+) dicitrate transport protein
MYRVGSVSVAALFAVLTTTAVAQEPPTPAPTGDQLPPVEVIQKQPTPAPAAKKKTAAKKKSVSPAPQPPAAVAEPAAAPESINPNSVYGSPAAGGAAERAYESAASPVNPSQIIPTNLQGYSSSASRITPADIKEQQPANINEALTRIPGVIVINDDADAHHGGIGLRGSPPRRSRKMLVMEDGHTVNLALWLDPSVHYWAPMDRLESIEVIRGTVINHGPNNNFGVINARNLSPFGPNETVISSAIGFTNNRGGSYTPAEVEIEAGEDELGFETDEKRSGKSTTDISARWHVHTRQAVDNVGLVASYTGSDVQGGWDTERLKVHDFYGALGFKGSSSDVVVSAVHARQKDKYDEQNFLGGYEISGDGITGETKEDALEVAEAIANKYAGLAEQQFHQLKHCKTCFAPASGLNTYTGEVWRGQIVHNAYLDEDTTITSRAYAGYHRRDRYQLITAGANPSGNPSGDYGENFEFEEDDDNDGQYNVTFGEDTMFGRLRTFRHLGGEVRGEWANRNVLGFKQDLQAGIRYEYQDMTNINFLGYNNQILGDGDGDGAKIFDRSLNVNTVSAFLQTNIHVAQDFNVLPGIRFEWFDVHRTNRVISAEEGEAGEEDDMLEIEGLVLNPDPRKESYTSFNALPGVAFAYTGLNRTTIYGGYHRGMTTGVLRNEDFPAPDEIGDNFNIGLRSTAIKGVQFEVAGFYQIFKDFQYGESFSAVAGDREFGRADEAEVSGVELYGRLNSQSFTGGAYNLFAEANYTYARSVLKKAYGIEEEDGDIETVDYSGNRVPETPWHVAALTLGIEKKTGWRWDASATWTYRGSFYTDAANTAYGYGGEVECETDDLGAVTECEVEEIGEGGAVPSIWLLSARFNLDIGDTGASVFVSGSNLLDKVYITDREDGMKIGLGRTIWTGFKYKF